jgi:hypothetical protein
MSAHPGKTLPCGLLYDAEAAEYLGLKSTTLRDWRARRRVPQPPYHKLGGKVYYSTADLDAFICSQRIEVR